MMQAHFDMIIPSFFSRNFQMPDSARQMITAENQIKFLNSRSMVDQRIVGIDVGDVVA